MFLRAVDGIGPRGSQMIVSLLEWSQTLALMAGGSRKEELGADSRWEKIRCLHARHVLNSFDTDVSQLDDLKTRPCIHRKDILFNLASDLENNPSSIEKWRRFVQELGPLRRGSRGRRSKSQRQSLKHDHAKREDEKWWGRERASWWRRNLLVLPVSEGSKSTAVTPKAVFAVGELVEQKMQDEGVAQISQNPEIDSPATYRGYGWLDKTIKSIRKALETKRSTRDSLGDGFDKVKKEKKKALKDPGPETRAMSLDEYLPKPLHPSRAFGASAATRPLIESVDAVNNEIEICCYKLLILAHISSTQDNVVRAGIWRLASTLKEEDETTNNSWNAIMWLASYGLNIPRILMDYHDELSLEHEKNKHTKHTEEHKAALRLGYACFGKKIVLIRDNVPLFASWDQQKVKNLYQSMERAGELGDAAKKLK